jgi:hypothetical protein
MIMKKKKMMMMVVVVVASVGLVPTILAVVGLFHKPLIPFRG